MSNPRAAPAAVPLAQRIIAASLRDDSIMMCADAPDLGRAHEKRLAARLVRDRDVGGVDWAARARSKRAGRVHLCLRYRRGPREEGDRPVHTGRAIKSTAAVRGRMRCMISV